MSRLKAKLRLESLTDRIVPASYATATDSWEWDEFSSDAVVMDDKPPVPAEPVSEPVGVEFTSAEAVAVPLTIEDIKNQLSKNPDAKAILDAAIKDGVKIETTTGTGFGGSFDPKNKVLKVDTEANQNNLHLATSTLLYELLRYKSSREQLDLDKKAKDGTLTKEQYATECEKLSYKYIKEHHTIAEKGVANKQWDASTDEYKSELADKLSTFEKYLAEMKKAGHYQVFENRYDSLRGPVPAPAPEPPPPEPV